MPTDSLKHAEGGPLPWLLIRPSTGLSSINLSELWEYRELLYFLTWRDIKVRYKQTLIGGTWAIIQPVATMIVFSLILGRTRGIAPAGVPYPLFNFCAVVPWTFFSNAVTQSGNSLVGSANLITKVYFPRLIVPGSAVLSGLLDLVLAFIVLLGLCFYYHIVPGAGALMVPLLVVLTMVLALGMGLWLSALNVQYRDIRYAIPFLIQLWMFASPVFYQLSFLPAKYRVMAILNPMAGLLEGYRSALLNRPFQWFPLGLAAFLSLLILISGAVYFRRMERTFADVV
ncbi:MAG: phosphate ABC transporter permease [Armatimonadetes bacterium CG2_30_59_28]|nr:ABC transporter permease [Armatimonadota bacterium]OIO90070.1 MAG: phosphate ABC transporter permease [Armatimonadetes bacterium CG2_30_59_28]PIU60533.1 MAG: phosphate ABC transporter permease [Armatimonadetes bacterium CG07_land_8_20_14_0_80_59_28]PIX43232.1 MAG: phosphate ABC transporter permease [Armatimonadetes bacterium CG_4_8_14_3_um_filter_58_9]PIY43145.1 MAG: phosphate ABC transporter permease [Armatimonadetes bacterium CG_4_10_14_3_um_filter_59_10]